MSNSEYSTGSEVQMDIAIIEDIKIPCPIHTDAQCTEIRGAGAYTKIRLPAPHGFYCETGRVTKNNADTSSSVKGCLRKEMSESAKKSRGENVFFHDRPPHSPLGEKNDMFYSCSTGSAAGRKLFSFFQRQLIVQLFIFVQTFFFCFSFLRFSDVGF